MVVEMETGSMVLVVLSFLCVLPAIIILLCFLAVFALGAFKLFSLFKGRRESFEKFETVFNSLKGRLSLKGTNEEFFEEAKKPSIPFLSKPYAEELGRRAPKLFGNYKGYPVEIGLRVGYEKGIKRIWEHIDTVVKIRTKASTGRSFEILRRGFFIADFDSKKHAENAKKYEEMNFMKMDVEFPDVFSIRKEKMPNPPILPPRIKKELLKYMEAIGKISVSKDGITATRGHYIPDEDALTGVLDILVLLDRIKF